MLSIAPGEVQGYFYRTSGGAEIDLVLSFASGSLWAVEIKRSLSLRPDKGFHLACADLNPARRFVVYPGDESFSVAPDIQVVSLASLAHMLQRQPRGAW